MKKTTEGLKEIINTYADKLKKVSENDFTKKPNADSWSRKEELGHLIDSAHNNLRRFIVTQYENQPIIVYDQNYWNSAANYQHQNITDLINLWLLLNKQIIAVLEKTPADLQERICDTGKQEKELHTISWLAADYIQHLLHHLHHLLGLEAIEYH